LFRCSHAGAQINNAIVKAMARLAFSIFDCTVKPLLRNGISLRFASVGLFMDSFLPALTPSINEREMTGYSGTPLPQKLGIRPGASVLVINGPKDYRKLLGNLPEGVRLTHRITARLDFVHLFTAQRDELERELKFLRPKLSDTGTLWVSWPKKSAGVATDVMEDTIRELALPLGLVDTKVCAVNEIWSGLKLMVRKEHRTFLTK
jgi:hypothetical protein